MAERGCSALHITKAQHLLVANLLISAFAVYNEFDH